MKSAILSELHWLEHRGGLQELIERYPAEWEEVGRELVQALKDGRVDRLNDLAVQAKNTEALWKARLRKDPANVKTIAGALPHLRRSRMWLLALEHCALAAATGRISGKIRFNLFNGTVVQRLLFQQGLERKPASLGWFRFWGPFLTQKRLLMPLVQAKGIDCFYSKKLIKALAELIADRTCLEIAAGDGTLSRFLGDAGIDIRSTDDHSWGRVIDYPDRVEKIDARAALGNTGPRR